MNITVKVDEVSLDTVVAEVFAFDSDGEEYQQGERTVADIVSAQIVDRLVQERGWPTLRDKVQEIRSEVIREVLRPQIEEAVAKPIQKTNGYGEPVGEPTTLRELIVDEVRKAVNAPANKYSSDRSSFLAQAVAKEVQNALGKEITDAVKQARTLVADQVGQKVADAVAEGMRKR
jgi:metal-responsive CopG/Arc/MetJ family transcriptional regulator